MRRTTRLFGRSSIVEWSRLVVSMQIALPELDSPVTLILDPDRPLTDEEYVAFCEANPDLRIERTAQGEMVIVPPAGFESDSQNVEVIRQLADWAIQTRRGNAVGSSTEFLLPNGAALSPDAAWVSDERLASVSQEQRRKFPRLTPEFVVEVKSPSDRLPAMKRKMREWIVNGVDLAWLIDGDARCVHVYRQGSEPEQLCNIERIAGEGPVHGFVLELERIWRR
jgi:Uma2 family endonuclease